MLSLQILNVLEENLGKRKWKMIKGYQAHSFAWGGDHVQPLEKEKISLKTSENCKRPLLKRLGDLFFLLLWQLFKPCLNPCDRFIWLSQVNVRVNGCSLCFAHTLLRVPAWSFSSVTIAFPFYNTVHSICFDAVNRSYSNFLHFYIVFFPFSDQHSGVQTLLFSWHSFAGQ